MLEYDALFNPEGMASELESYTKLRLGVDTTYFLSTNQKTKYQKLSSTKTWSWSQWWNTWNCNAISHNLWKIKVSFRHQHWKVSDTELDSQLFIFTFKLSILCQKSNVHSNYKMIRIVFYNWWLCQHVVVHIQDNDYNGYKSQLFTRYTWVH